MNPFWDFSLEVYELPGMQNTLLELQDLPLEPPKVEADINILLYCLWLASSGRVIRVDNLARSGLHVLQQQVSAMRKRRRQVADDLKQLAPDYYQRLLAQELVLEQRIQSLLYRRLSLLSQQSVGEIDEKAFALENLKAYFCSLGHSISQSEAFALKLFECLPAGYLSR